MISVIVPVYNVKPFLREAVDSLLRQTYADLEIILIDDGSADGSGEICDEYQTQDARVRVLHEENRGLSAARNRGLDVCRGEYIAFLDSDDAFCPDMLETLYRAIQETGADVVECNFALYHDVQRLDPESIRSRPVGLAPGMERKGLYSGREALRLCLKQIIGACVWNKLFRRYLWDGLRFPVGHNYEDLDIVLPLFSRPERVCLLDEPLVLRRIRAGSITSTHSEKNIRDRILAYEHQTDYVKSHIPELFDEDDYQGLLVTQHFSLLGQYYLIGISDFPDKEKRMELLKKRVFELERQLDLRACGLRARAASFICRRLPSAAPAIYRVYTFFRLLIEGENA